MMKRFLCIAGLVGLVLPSAWGFSLTGPFGNAGDSWQTPAIDYGPPIEPFAPKNIGEGYRPNVPVMYYAYTPAFLDYFGTAGVTNLDDAFTNLLNNALSDNGQGGLTNYSPGLTEVPLDSAQINYTAQALQLWDIKSVALSEMMLHLGLDFPELDTWRLHERFLPPGLKCPIDEEYTVIQRNYGITPTDFNQIQYTPYVNNTLYSFEIEEFCTGPDPLSLTVPFPVDALGDAWTSVAGENIIYGQFYTGLTSDDIAGVRYLLNPANVNWETVEGGSLLFDQSTNLNAGETQFPLNPNTSQGYGTFSLASLYSFATTNTPAAVAAAFPGVVVASSTSYFVLASNATFTAYFAPVPIGYPIGTAPTLAFVTNYTLYLATNYITKFANVVPVTTNAFTTNFLLTVTTGLHAGYPYGSALVTNTTLTPIIQKNIPSGDFYTVPVFGTNLCGSGIQFLGLSLPVLTTNLVTSINTNLVTATNTTAFSVTQSIISSYTTHIYVGYPVTCGQTANATGLYQGINKVQFVRVDYDSLLGQVIQPFTNGFTMVAITNSQTRLEHFDRLVTVPDILLDAQDLAAVTATVIGYGAEVGDFTVPEFDQANILPGLAGPGTLALNPTAVANSFAPIVLKFDKVGNIYANGSLATYNQVTNSFLSQINQFQIVALGSFDGTTNDPVVYPNGSSIQNLQNELLLQISPTAAQVQLVAGNVGSPYLASGTNIVFTITGGGGAFDLTDPFTWSTAGTPGLGGTPTSGLPPGLMLAPSTGVLSGTPTQAGTYDFTLTFTDYYSRSVQWSYTIIIQ